MLPGLSPQIVLKVNDDGSTLRCVHNVTISVVVICFYSHQTSNPQNNSRSMEKIIRWKSVMIEDGGGGAPTGRLRNGSPPSTERLRRGLSSKKSSSPLQVSPVHQMRRWFGGSKFRELGHKDYRARWELAECIYCSIIYWPTYMYSYVKLNFKANLLSCIFLFEAPYIAKSDFYLFFDLLN